jgi:hypothetical protein
MVKSIRESKLFHGNRLTERKSLVGSFNPYEKDIFRDRIWFPHEEMQQCVEMYNRNSFAQSAINTMKDFIKGGDIVVKSDDKHTRERAQQYLESLNIDIWIDEVIENALKTGNSYLEIDYEDDEWKNPHKCYPIADSSQIYINCDEFALPKVIDEIITDPITKEPKKVRRRNEEEYFVQRINPMYRIHQAKWYDMSYHYGSLFHKFRIYGVPINKRKLIHFKLNLGDTGVYGRSYMASALDDFETLKQIERSIAIIAKYKAVPRDIIMYGDKDNPSTDEELDEFIVYLESLEKDESAIVNKPIKRESLAYSGQDINLDYMIQHIRKKIISGIAPDFMMGLGDQVNKATAQISLISYILAIYSKRRLFLKPIEQFLLKPFLRKNHLKDAHLEFGELDFETKSEKVNRVGGMWTTNLLTFNEARNMLGMPNIGETGDVYYLEWQSGMMEGNPMGGFGMPQFQAPPQEEALPNGEDISKVFSHNEPANSKTIQGGGAMPHDPYAPKTDTPKFLPKTSSNDSWMNYFKNERPTKQQVKEIYAIDAPDDYHLESRRDFGDAAAKKEVEKINRLQESSVRKQISFDTLMGKFNFIFNKPKPTEVYYHEIEDGFRVSFIHNLMLVMCDVKFNDILKHYAGRKDLRKITNEDKKTLINEWFDRHLSDAIKEIK